MQNFTHEELKNILALIGLAPIKGSEAVTVALLQQKINQMLAPTPGVVASTETVPEEVPEKPKEE